MRGFDGSRKKGSLIAYGKSYIGVKARPINFDAKVKICRRRNMNHGS
jgi:hypothetical protein